MVGQCLSLESEGEERKITLGCRSRPGCYILARDSRWEVPRLPRHPPVGTVTLPSRWTIDGTSEGKEAEGRETQSFSSDV